MLIPPPRRIAAAGETRVSTTLATLNPGGKNFMANPFSFRRILLVLTLCLWAAGKGALAAEFDLSKAEALMKEGKAAEAYTLLEPYEFEQSGNVKFDYLLGIAALDSGKPDKATLAFERVLAVDPDFAGARIDMGRAYFQLGDYSRAKTEFETVLTQDPPPAAKTTIDNYLAAIQKQESAKQTKATGYVEATFGRDNNVNFATSQNQITVPALGNLIFTLNPSNVKTPDSYAGIALGGEFSRQITSNVSFFGGLDARARDNQDQKSFNSTSIDGRAGLAVGVGAASVVRLGILGGRFELDGKRNRDTNGLSGEWRYTLNPANQLSAFAQHARYRFEPAISVNNFDQATLGANWLRLVNDGKAMFSTTLLTGSDRVPSGSDGTPLRADGGKRFNGARVGTQVQFNEKLDLFGGIGVQWSRYDWANAAFSTATDALIRADKMYDANIGANWHLDKNWTLRPLVSYLRNNSNIAIYQHDRRDISITLRRDFK